MKSGYLAENEAVKFSGVSATTLSRFAEAGYFQIETSTDDTRLYRRDELAQLFGIEDKTGIEPANNESCAAGNLAIQSKPVFADTSDDVQMQDSEESTAVDNARIIPFPGTELFASTTHSDFEVTPTLPVNNAESDQIEASHLSEAEEQQQQSATSISITEQRLELICEMQEKLLTDREQRITALQDEIRWLRERLEKAEQKSDRDQVILLSETQLLRQFLENQQQQRRSTLRTLLEWMGMAKPEESNNRQKTIELQGSASNK